MVQTGSARTSANSFNNQFGNPSGPEALRGLSFFKAKQISNSDRMGGGGGARTPRHKEQRIAEVGRLAGLHGLEESVIDQVGNFMGIKIVNLVKMEFRA